MTMARDHRSCYIGDAVNLTPRAKEAIRAFRGRPSSTCIAKIGEAAVIGPAGSDVVIAAIEDTGYRKCC